MTMKLYAHVYLPNKHRNPPQTFIMNLDEIQQTQLTLEQLNKSISKIDKEINPTYIKIQSGINSKPLQNKSMLVSSLFNDQDDIYFFCDLPKPVIIEEQQEEQKQLYFQSIEKYSFYEYDETRVKVLLELPGIGSIPKNNITCRFLERSIELNILEYKGKNWRFAVPKTQCKLAATGNKILVKPDKIIITIQKFQKNDNWFSLFKAKTIGGDDD